MSSFCASPWKDTSSRAGASSREARRGSAPGTRAGTRQRHSSAAWRFGSARSTRYSPEAEPFACASSTTPASVATSWYAVRGFEGSTIQGCQWPGRLSPGVRVEKRATSITAPLCLGSLATTALEDSRGSSGVPAQPAARPSTAAQAARRRTGIAGQLRTQGVSLE